jgi:hypothetical protein
MRLMRKIAVVLAGIALTLGGTALPARADTVYGCPDSWICLYQHDNYVGGKYSFHVQALYPIGIACINLPNAGQTGWTGGQVNNKVSSLILNSLEVSGGDQFFVYIYDGSNCNVLNGDIWRFTASSGVAAVNSLSNIGWNDRATSINLQWR